MVTTPVLGRVADYVNTELRGREKENPLMRGMNPGAITKNEDGLGQSVEDFEDMVEKLVDEEGFHSHNRPYFQSDPNATDSVNIAASYATGGGDDYLLIQFDDDAEDYHMFGREYHVPSADWSEIDSMVASEENAELLEDELEDIDEAPEVVATEGAPEEYRENRDVPDPVKNQDDWYDVVYTVEEELLE